MEGESPCSIHPDAHVSASEQHLILSNLLSIKYIIRKTKDNRVQSIKNKPSAYGKTVLKKKRIRQMISLWIIIMPRAIQLVRYAVRNIMQSIIIIRLYRAIF